MTVFTKKQVPFCEWGQSAQLSIYYYDKKTCFLHFFAFFQIQYLYILCTYDICKNLLQGYTPTVV